MSSKTYKAKGPKSYKGVPHSELNARHKAFQRDHTQRLIDGARAEPVYPEQLERFADQRAPFDDLITKLYNGSFRSNLSLDIVDTHLRSLEGKGGRAPTLRGWVWKRRGAELFKQGDFAGSRDAFVRAIRAFIGGWDSYPLPCLTAVNTALQPVDPGQFAEVTMCANNVAQCFTKEMDQVSVRPNLTGMTISS